MMGLWGGEKKNAHMTDVLPRKKVNILKINLQSMVRAA